MKWIKYPLKRDVFISRCLPCGMEMNQTPPCPLLMVCDQHVSRSYFNGQCIPHADVLPTAGVDVRSGRRSISPIQWLFRYKWKDLEYLTIDRQ